MVAQHTQNEDTTTENENDRSDSSSSNTSDTDPEQTDVQSEHDIDEMKNTAVNELCDIESATGGPHGGIERGRVIGFLRDEFGISRDRAEEVIYTALMEDYCYEPGVSEETGDTLLKLITRPITNNENDQTADSDEASKTTSHEPTSEGGEDAPEDSTTIDLDQVQSFFQGNTSDTHTVKSITESVESGLLTGSEIALGELESAIRDSQWDAELRKVVLSAIETLREEREAQREFARKLENGEIEPDPDPVPKPVDWDEREGAESPSRPPVDPDAEPEPERDDTDPILDEYHDHYQPEFPGQMSGESIHLEDDDMEWREPRSLY